METLIPPSAPAQTGRAGLGWLLLGLMAAAPGQVTAAEGPTRPAEIIEEFRLADGRTLVGRYSEVEQKLYLSSSNPTKVRVALSVAATDIVERKPWPDRTRAERRPPQPGSAPAAAAAIEAERRQVASEALFHTDLRTLQAAEAKHRRDEALRAEAVTRAAYWYQRGVEFDPDTTTARDMDIQGPQLLLKVDQQRQAAARAAVAAAETERRLQQEQSQARDRERILEEARIRQREQALAQAAAQADLAAKQAAWLRESQDRMEADRQRYLRERRNQETAVLVRRVVTLGALVIMFAFPALIALVRRHRHRVPIVVLSAMTLGILVLGSLGLMHPVFLMLVPWDAAMLLGGVFGLLAWMVAVVWAFMPNPPPIPAPAPVPDQSAGVVPAASGASLPLHPQQPSATVPGVPPPPPPPVGTGPSVALPALAVAAPAGEAVTAPVPAAPSARPGAAPGSQRSEPLRHRQSRTSRPAQTISVKGVLWFMSSSVVGIGGGLLVVHLLASGRYLYSDLTAVPLGNDPVHIEASDYPAVMATTCTVTDVWCIRDNGEVICGVWDYQGKRGVLYSRASVPVGALVHAKRLGTAYITRDKPIRYLPEDQFQGRPIPDAVEPAVIYLHIPDTQLEQLRGQLTTSSGVSSSAHPAILPGRWVPSAQAAPGFQPWLLGGGRNVLTPVASSGWHL